MSPRTVSPPSAPSAASAISARRARAAGRMRGVGSGASSRALERDAGGRSVQLAEIQRSRLLAAAVRAVDELGWANTSVADVVARSRISRRTFYETFANREECLAAVFEDILGLLVRELDAAGLGGLGWCERVRTGLFTILSFLDREPVLARVLVVQALSGGPVVLARREETLARLATVVGEGRAAPRASRCTPLTAEGLVGAAFGIVYARLLRGERRPLIDLLGELMGMIVLPYLGSAAARREQARPRPVASRRVSPADSSALLAGRAGAEGENSLQAVADPLESVPMRLTYRTSRVLEGVAELAEHGLGPSNRQVAEHAGIDDAGQVSKLLRRLERLGLLENGGLGHDKGAPNAWRLTPMGEQVARSIRAHSRREEVAV